MSVAVSLRNLSCVFHSAGEKVHAVSGVNLDIEAGEFFTLLGPSGSGKTTCLRMIGGFVLPTEGTVAINGQDMTQHPPYARPVNTVFQDYALFPHMNILDNVAYSLMVRGVDLATRAQRAHELLDLVQLPDLADRKPAQLSGGQRQRVALARALISEPKVLLLDEPLGALDLKLREQMQIELKALQRSLGITFVFVTHDQHEALSMSDRIGVFNQGCLEQVATPANLYHRPANRFVAEFVGAANVLLGAEAERYASASALMIRPESITICEETQPDAGRVRGFVVDVQFFGAFWRVQVQPDHGGDPLLADLPVQSFANAPAVGKRLGLQWEHAAMHVLEGSH